MELFKKFSAVKVGPKKVAVLAGRIFKVASNLFG